jgi:hypothetical protein
VRKWAACCEEVGVTLVRLEERMCFLHILAALLFAYRTSKGSCRPFTHTLDVSLDVNRLTPSRLIMANLTVLQRTNMDGFPKAGELIEITGAHELEATDRALLNALFQHAHESGKLATPGATWEVSLAALRLSSHESNDRLRESLSRLLSVQVKVSYRGQAAREMVLQTHLFDAFITPKDGGGPGGGNVRFGVPDALRAVLAQSGRWGRIKAEVVCAMSSKYAIALYEMVQLRANMDRCIETFPLARFRDLMGVPPGKLLRGPDFKRFVVDPAVVEVNGISDMGVTLSLERHNKTGAIEAVIVAWWRKESDELQAAMRERDRSKIGRMARLRGQVEVSSALQSSDSSSSNVILQTSGNGSGGRPSIISGMDESASA